MGKVNLLWISDTEQSFFQVYLFKITTVDISHKLKQLRWKINSYMPFNSMQQKYFSLFHNLRIRSIITGQDSFTVFQDLKYQIGLIYEIFHVCVLRK